MTPPSAHGSWWIWLGRALRASLFYSIVLMLLAVGALLFSEHAPRWLWQQIQADHPELKINELSGTLATGLQVKSLRWQNESMALRMDEAAISLDFTELFNGRLGLDALRIKRVDLRMLKVSEAARIVLPPLTVPMPWRLSGVNVQQLSWTAFNGVPVVVNQLALEAQGHGSALSISHVALAYAQDAVDVQVKAQAELTLAQQWPVEAAILLKTNAWPSQRITLAGNLSALRVRWRGPAKYPVALEATVNALMPTLPFHGRLAWPRWQPPAQNDWQLEPGAMTFAGSTEQGELALDLAATLAKDSQLPWPASEPRHARLNGPLRWQKTTRGITTALAWRGRMGNAPWTVDVRYQQALPAQTRIALRLADAVLGVKGWPGSGFKASLQVPRLQRFQHTLSGSFNATVAMVGSLQKHRLIVSADGEQGSLAIEAQGGINSELSTWRGVLARATLRPKHGNWQLQRSTALFISAQNSQLDSACWRQIDARLSPWELCTRARLTPKQWLATVTAQAPKGGRVEANFRRNAQLADPALDAEIRWQAINVAALPVALPEGLIFSGRSDGDIRVSGSIAKPRLIGTWSVGARLQWPRYGLNWPEMLVNGQFSGESSRWTASLKDSSNGQLNLSGQATWQPVFTMRMEVIGSNLAFGYAPWVQGRASPTLSLAWQADQLRVAGDVLIKQANITLKSLAASAPKPSPDVILVRARDGRWLALDEAPTGLPLNMRLRLVLGDDVALTGYGLDAGLKGQLMLTQTPNTPLAAYGEISLKPNAQFAAYGQRLSIEQGQLVFAGPLTTPSIRLRATRNMEGITVGLNVTGQAPKPSVTLSSDSPMSQDEILSYLVLGLSLGNNQPSTAADKQALALSAALNLTGKTGVVGLLGQRLGITDFSIGTQGSSDATELAVSGRLSPSLWLSVGRGVFEPSQSVTVRYQINRRLSLEALSALESAITLFYSWRF